MRRLLRIVAALLVSMVAFGPVYALLVPEALPETSSLAPIADRAYRVSVVDWGYHTAIVIEQPVEWRLGPPGMENARYLEYAWGDRRFYLESDFRPHALMATLFLPTEAVLYVQGRTALPQAGSAEVLAARTVTASQLQVLAAHLERYAKRDASGKRQAPFAPAAGYRGRFYPAYGRYLWSRDCNWWTVALLARAGLATSAFGVVFTPQVFARLTGFESRMN